MPRTTTLHAVTAIGIDMGKTTLHMIGLDARGAIVLRERVSRGRIASRLANVPPCLIGIEAGMATHYVARELTELGHDVKQVPATYAKPFRHGHKNDFRDAHAVAEAVQRPTTRFVPAKTNEQLDLQALHRVRSRLVSERTAVINQIRGFLLERSIIVRQGLRFLRQLLPDILAKRTDVLSPRIVRIVIDLAGDWRQLDERIETVTDEIETLAKSEDSCRRVMTVPGIGPIISSAMVAAIGSGVAFAKGRDFSAWLGLVPKQMSTGDRTILGRISKRGNGYLRMLFMQAARSFCCGRRTGRNTASGSGSFAPLSAYIRTFWPRRLPTNWRGSPGPCWCKSAAIRRASRRQQPEMKALRFTKGMAAASRRPRRSPD
jgi:transposase